MAFFWIGNIRTGNKDSEIYSVNMQLQAANFDIPSSLLLFPLLFCYGYAAILCCLLISELSGVQFSWHCMSSLPSFLFITAQVSWPPSNSVIDHLVFESCRCGSGGVSKGHLDCISTRNHMQENLHSPDILLNQFLKTTTEKPQLS